MRPTRRFGFVALALAGALLLAIPGAAVASQPQRVTLDVEGMVCSGCEDTVESVVRGAGGVSAAEADHTTETVSVTYDGAATAPSTIVAAINDNTYYRASLAASPAAAAPPPAPREASGGGFGPGITLLALAGTGCLILAASRVRRRRAAG